MVDATGKISKDCSLENYDSFSGFYIICFMDYSVCGVPTLITVLISQCVTKMLRRYNYSHMLLSFSNSPGLIASFFRRIYVVQLNSKLVHE